MKKCPWLFTLAPSKGFKLLDTMMESLSKDVELDLTLYCQFESGPHTTKNSIYRFRPDGAAFDGLKKDWNVVAQWSKRLGPVLGLVSGTLKNLPEFEVDPLRRLVGQAGGLERGRDPEMIDLEMRGTLEDLLGYLDKTSTHRNGGLHPYQRRDTGEYVWLCPEHRKQYEKELR